LNPPLGWTSWSTYQCNEVAGTIEAAAAAIHGSAVQGSPAAPGSLQSLGYGYVNNDGCWDLVGTGGETGPEYVRTRDRAPRTVEATWKITLRRRPAPV
jgi:hypothetical protein